MNYSYATCKEAADTVSITPEEIGVPASNYVRKKELIATNKFDPEKLTSYSDNDFVLLKDLAVGSFTVSVALNSDITGRGTVQINGGSAGATASTEVNLGDNVTVTCNLSDSSDVFDGWYEGEIKVSGNATYDFTATKEVSLVSKAFYIDVEPTSLDFEAAGGEKSFNISSNVPSWTIS